MNVATREPLEQIVAHCAVLIRAHGIHSALEYLNSRTRHRYTGAYLFNPPILRNVSLFDRENPAIRCGGDTPMDETYCSLVGAEHAPFQTADAARDVRLTDHPARQSVLAYCGVPLLNEHGTSIGSLCHFDLRPRVVPAGESLLLRAVAPLVAAAVLGPTP